MAAADPDSTRSQVLTAETDCYSLLRRYSDPALTELPSDLMKRGRAYCSALATQLLNAHYNDLGETHIVNTRHNGAIADWPADWVLEMPCKIDRKGIHPLKAEPLPGVCFELLARVKSYELLKVQAAMTGDRAAAYEALLAHPLGPKSGQVQAVLDDMLLTHRLYLSQFLPKGSRL